MSVKVKVLIGVSLQHLSEIFHTLQRIHDAQCVRQHDAFHVGAYQCVHHLVDILRRVLHARAPVFKVYIHVNAFLVGISQHLHYLSYMLLGRLLQLLHAVAQRTLYQQVYHLSATVGNPVYRPAAIHESEHLNPLQHVSTVSILTYHAHSIFLTLRHSSRRHLYAVYVDITQQHTCYHQLLVGQEADATRLLTIPEGGVHYLYKAIILHYNLKTKKLKTKN